MVGVISSACLLALVINHSNVSSNLQDPQASPVQSSIEANFEAPELSFDDGSFDVDTSPVPSMPSIPAPVLPPEVLAQLSNSIITTSPYGIALYDYVASHPDDLSIKVRTQLFNFEGKFEKSILIENYGRISGR